jgi:hypothetical protein
VLSPKLPNYDYSLVIRTDFSDEAAWECICKLIQAPQPETGFQAMVECISDKACLGMPPEKVASLLPHNSQQSFVFLVDAEAVAHHEHPVIVVDLLKNPSRTFRVIPSQAWGVENNLRLANMDFEEFAMAVEKDGVFRGFSAT